MSEALQLRGEGLDATEAIKRGRGRFLWEVIKERPSAAIGAALIILFTVIAVFSHWL